MVLRCRVALTHAGASTSGLSLWLPTLLVLTLHFSAAQAASMMIAFSQSGLVGRVMSAFLADAIGRSGHERR